MAVFQHIVKCFGHEEIIPLYNVYYDDIIVGQIRIIMKKENKVSDHLNRQRNYG